MKNAYLTTLPCQGLCAEGFTILCLACIMVSNIFLPIRTVNCIQIHEKDYLVQKLVIPNFV